MNLTSRQVAEKLNCNTGTILRLAREKKLTDVGKTVEGKTKHEYIFNSTEVNEFAKTYKNRKVSLKMNNINNSIQTVPMIFQERLNRIEQKLDLIIKMWS